MFNRRSLVRPSTRRQSSRNFSRNSTENRDPIILPNIDINNIIPENSIVNEDSDIVNIDSINDNNLGTRVIFNDSDLIIDKKEFPNKRSENKNINNEYSEFINISDDESDKIVDDKEDSKVEDKKEDFKRNTFNSFGSNLSGIKFENNFNEQDFEDFKFIEDDLNISKNKVPVLKEVKVKHNRYHIKEYDPEVKELNFKMGLSNVSGHLRSEVVETFKKVKKVLNSSTNPRTVTEARNLINNIKNLNFKMNEYNLSNIIYRLNMSANTLASTKAKTQEVSNLKIDKKFIDLIDKNYAKERDKLINITKKPVKKSVSKSKLINNANGVNSGLPSIYSQVNKVNNINTRKLPSININLNNNRNKVNIFNKFNRSPQVQNNSNARNVINNIINNNNASRNPLNNFILNNYDYNLMKVRLNKGNNNCDRGGY